jgi:hypothetical protein
MDVDPLFDPNYSGDCVHRLDCKKNILLSMSKTDSLPNQGIGFLVDKIV